MIPYLLITNNLAGLSDKISELKTKNQISDNLVFEFLPDGTTFKIETIRSVISFINTSGSDKKMLILRDFDLCKVEGQNALLKTLEEKNRNNLFILTATNKSAILDTILSRCKTVRLIDKKPRKSSKEPISLISENRNQLFADNEGIDREGAIRVCKIFEMLLRAEMKTSPSQKVVECIKELLKTRRLIEKNNVNAQISIDHLIIYLTK